MRKRTRPVEDFAAEIESHLQLESDSLQEEGLSADEARALAHQRFGNVAGARERFYESGRWLWRDRLSQDLRYASRMLRHSPGFAAIAILTIAIGVGATTAMFSVVDATLLHPLPYPHPEQLVGIEDDLPGVGAQDVGLSQPEWLDLQRSGIFDAVSPAWFDENNLTGASQPERVRLSSVAPNFFALLGVAPQLGRTFPPADRSPGFTLEVVISDGLWKRDFGGDPHILDRNVRLDTDLYRIVGVMPPGFHAPGRTTQERNIDVWAATSFYGPPMSDHPARNNRNLPGAIARLSSGLTLDAAQRRVDVLVESLQRQFPADYPASSAWTVRLVPLQDSVVGDIRSSLLFVFGAVALVLLIACVNVANLMLARASTRGHEMAVRQALGASGRRLIRQLLTESVLLSFLGGMTALAVLYVTRSVLVRLIPETLPHLNDISISWGVWLFALVLTLVAGGLCGLAPAWQAGRLDVTHALKREGRGSTHSKEQTRMRHTFVVAEVALSVVLLVAAGLLFRSVRDLIRAPLGFDPHGVMTIRTRLPYPNDITTDRYRTSAQQAPFFRELMRRINALPGVDEVAVGNTRSIPLDHAQRDLTRVPVIVEGRATQRDQAPLVDGSIVTPGYFHLLRMTAVRGRLFNDFDNETAPPVAVINQATADSLWPHEDPVGQHVKLTPSASSWTTVVGIVANARTESLRDAAVPEIYTSLYQMSTKHAALFLRGQIDRIAASDCVREQVQAVDSTLPVFDAQMLEDTLSASLAERRFSMNMIAVFGLTALLLTGVGMYGVIAYHVSERTHEIRVRLALGAQGRSIVSMVLREGLAITVTGTIVGLAGALIVARAMSGLLYGVRSTDVATFLTVATVLMGVSLCACYLPARRAIRTGALMGLRCE